jgi:Flp pilus assembly protein TadG
MIHRVHRYRGMAVIEMALLLPLLLILTFGMIEYSWMFLKQQNITNTARAGVRIAATADSTNAEVNAQVTSMMNSYGLGSSGYNVNITPGNVATAARGTMITVEITMPYANAQITGMSIFPVPDTIRAAVTMEKEGH